EDGLSEVQLGHTHVMGFVTSQLVQPYRDRPNEGTLAIFTEFSPMADPSFEAGRPGESAVELGRVIDRGLRESRAIDTESLCVVAGKFVWAIRIDLHILDNGGNLVDAANIAALAALSTFRRPECSLGGKDAQEVIVHPPEVVDPTHYEEAVMGGRMTATVNINGDVCAIQKAGGVGVMHSVIMQCLRIASVKAADMTTKIKNAHLTYRYAYSPQVESYKTERSQRMIKRHTSTAAVDVSEPSHKEINVLLRHHLERSTIRSGELIASSSNAMEIETQLSEQDEKQRDGGARTFIGGPSNWDPLSKGVDSDALKVSLASRGI
ncbi:hypothetical protein RJ639_022085, partial [Escallonia herrerae]